MQIRFDEIPEDGLTLTVKDDSWFPDHDVVRHGPVAATVALEKKGQRVLLEGTLKATVALDCDRCLEEYDYAADLHFTIDLELTGQDRPSQALREHSCSSSEMDVMFLDEPLIDIGYILQQQIFLAVPLKKLCSPSCRGLCPQCGVNLNNEPCQCTTAGSSSPFSVLESLKVK